MNVETHQRVEAVHDALASVRHLVPADLTRDVEYYLSSAQDPELAFDVLVDGLVEGRILIARDELDHLRAAAGACGRHHDRRVAWIEAHGMRPLAGPGEDDED